ncbi:adaptor protein MecA [Anaerostipes sp. MSJ-23]|uniref:adaptor protein MecA n=1 Tax=unclassified Anaerostipes TaxID=2635253 RepID=UPI00209ED467|nr:adaptor protein MecA [Anaerostipes sp. MSJ-23]
MKIERISDNQIRCTLNKEDLEGKETLLNELAFGSDKAKGLFRELMKKASAELGFETNDIPLMVEAIPVSKECLILVITRVDNPEDFNEHYKKLAKNMPSDHISVGNEEDLLDLLNHQTDHPLKGTEDPMRLALADSSTNIYYFQTLEEVSAAAKMIRDYTTRSSLYKDPVNHCYYLTLSIETDDPKDNTMDMMHSVLSEYCRRLPNTYATKALFNEHLVPIIKTQAVEEMIDYE